MDTITFTQEEAFKVSSGTHPEWRIVDSKRVHDPFPRVRVVVTKDRQNFYAYDHGDYEADVIASRVVPQQVVTTEWVTAPQTIEYQGTECQPSPPQSPTEDGATTVSTQLLLTSETSSQD